MLKDFLVCSSCLFSALRDQDAAVDGVVEGGADADRRGAGLTDEIGTPEPNQSPG